MEKFSVPVLFTKIFIPAAFLLVVRRRSRSSAFRPQCYCKVVFSAPCFPQVCIIHLHYFHEPFLQLTDLKTVVETHNSTITRSMRLDPNYLNFFPDLPGFST